MDSQEELKQLIGNLDDIKNQSLEYTQKYVQGKKEPRASIEKINKSFSTIKEILERKASPFAQEKKEVQDSLRDTPGIKIRRRGLSWFEGIGPAYATKLKDAGITSPLALLSKAASPRDRKSLAKTTGVSQDQILRWVSTADLFRVRGIGQGYADLLEDAGVDTTQELAQRKPENLLQEIIEVNEQKKLVRQVPGLSQVSDWVGQAKKLDRVIKY